MSWLLPAGAVTGGAAAADGAAVGCDGAAAGGEAAVADGAAADCDGAAADCDGAAVGCDGVTAGTESATLMAEGVTAGLRPGGVAPYTLAADDDAVTEPEPAASSAKASISVRTKPRRPVRKTNCRGDSTTSSVPEKALNPTLVRSFKSCDELCCCVL
jgi:hypothetical protein